MTKLKTETAGVIFDTRLARQLTGGSGWRLPRRVTEYFMEKLGTCDFSALNRVCEWGEPMDWADKFGWDKHAPKCIENSARRLLLTFHCEVSRLRFLHIRVEPTTLGLELLFSTSLKSRHDAIDAPSRLLGYRKTCRRPFAEPKMRPPVIKYH